MAKISEKVSFHTRDIISSVKENSQFDSTLFDWLLMNITLHYSLKVVNKCNNLKIISSNENL